jgi:hypothetical protein
MGHNHLWIGSIIGSIVCMGILVFLGVIFYTNNDAPRRQETQEEEEQITQWKAPTQIPILTNEEINTNDEVARLSISIHYPKIALIQHPEFAKEGNAVVTSFIEDLKTEFIKNEAAFHDEGVTKDIPSNLTIRWNALLIAPTLISLRFDISEYLAGAAHPNTRVQILNYDFTKKERLSTINLFASSTQALPFLSERARKTLSKTFGDISDTQFQVEVIPGTEPTRENFKEVGITKEGLLVIFNPYQVAAYARGTPSVFISLQELGDLISPEIREAMTLANTNIVEASPIEP